jgi:hypothetical protein
MKFTALLIAIAFLLAGCQEDNSSDAKQRVAQEQLAAQGNAVVGMPAIVNFQEKRILKDIIEMRDKSIVTITYTQDLNAGLHKLCDSIGFGISAATQYTNPMRVYQSTTSAVTTLPQADPNGLFSPASAEGTWVMCKDPHSSKVAPIYSEPRIIVSPFPLN